MIRSAVAVAVAVAVLLLPGALGAQERTVRRADLQRLLPDSVLRQRMVRLDAGQTQTVSPQAQAITLDSGQTLATRTGSSPEKLRTGLRVAVAVQTAPDTSPVTGAPEPVPSVLPPGSVEPGQPGPVADVRDAGEQLALPFSYVVASADGSALLALRPVYVPRSRLRYDAASGRFRGSFYLTLQDTLRPAQSVALAAAVRLQLVSDADSLLPALLEVSHTNFPLQEIAVSARQVGDSVRVRIIPEFDPRGVDVWLGSEPSLMLVSAARRIAGFGVQGTELTIALRGGGTTTPVVVSLQADRGSVEPARVRVQPGEAAAVRVRSAGVGRATIQAVTPNLGSESIVIEFGWPVLFLLAALLGGAFGGVVVELQARRNGAPGHLGQRVLFGIVSGFLAATVYYAIGLNLLGLQVDIGYFNEAAVFAFAAVAGMVGIPLAGAVARRTPPAPPPPQENP